MRKLYTFLMVHREDRLTSAIEIGVGAEGPNQAHARAEANFPDYRVVRLVRVEENSQT